MNWQEIVKYNPQKYDSKGNRNKLQFVGEFINEQNVQTVGGYGVSP